jgi:hypothetical protein
MSYSTSYRKKRKKELFLTILVGVVIFFIAIIPLCSQKTIDIEPWVPNKGQSGYLRISLKWNTLDDLDILVVDPNNEELWFKNKSVSSGGILDVDDNVMDSTAHLHPLENIYYKKKPPKGMYKVFVNLYKKRSPPDQSIPFSIRIEKNQKVNYLNAHISESNQNIKDQNKMIRIKEFRF